jgi:hypothetical protein
MPTPAARLCSGDMSRFGHFVESLDVRAPTRCAVNPPTRAAADHPTGMFCATRQAVDWVGASLRLR